MLHDFPFLIALAMNAIFSSVYFSFCSPSSVSFPVSLLYYLLCLMIPVVYF